MRNKNEGQLNHLLACAAFGQGNITGIAELFIELLKAGGNPSVPVKFVIGCYTWQVSAWKIFLSRPCPTQAS